MDNATRFINAFVKIEKKLKEMVNTTRYIKFYQLIEMCRKNNLVVKINARKLLDYSDLRNVLIHQRDDNDEILAIPTNSVVNEIEKIARLMEEGKPILEFSSHPVKTVGLKDDLTYAYKTMRSIGTTKIPVYDQSGYLGLLTMECIASSLLNGGYKDIGNIIKDNNKKNKVVFFNEKRSIDDVIDEFEKHIERGSSLSAIIITKNGTNTEIPLGIITVYDLPKIMTYFL